MQLESDIEVLEKEKAILDSKARSRTNIIYGGLYALLLAEFGAAYLMIYEVSWLGWDLIEPLTYSIA
jgi:hypothetical protein